MENGPDVGGGPRNRGGGVRNKEEKRGGGRGRLP